jgi:putative ABC transport system permease protein
MRKTGIPFNFGITVALGFIVGTAIAAQTFYLFTIENIKQYGALKAMGAGNWSLLGMILLQALLVSVIGFGLGIGGAIGFGMLASAPGSRLAFYMPLEVFLATALSVIAISMLSSLLSLQRVMVVEPAVVFQG